MKKFYSLLIVLFITVAAMSQTTYTWQGANNASWAVSTNWTPTRTTPNASDVLQFNDGTTKNVTGVPTQTFGRIIVTSNTTVTLQAAAGVTLTVGGAVAVSTDLIIDAGSALTMGTNVNVTLATNNNVSAAIAGTLTVGAGRTFDANNGQNLTTVTGTIDNSGTISGTAARLLFSAGGTYVHSQDGGTIPTAGWDAASNCNITGVTATVPAAIDQTFGNLTWNCAGQSAEISTSTDITDINGNFTVTNTNNQVLRPSNGSDVTFNIGGNFVINGANAIYVIQDGNNTTNNKVYNVAGNFSLSAGTLRMTSVNSALGTSQLNVAGNFSATGGTLTELGTGTSNVAFNGTAVQTFTAGSTIANTINFTINNNAKVDFGTAVLGGSNGTFTLAAGGKIITANAGGVPSTIAVTGTKSYNSGADYEFGGTATGVFTTTPTAATVRNLTINNASGNVTLSQPMAVTGALALTSGALTTTATNIVTVNAGGTTSGTSFVNGPMAKVGNTVFTFPVGKVGAGLRTIGITAPSSSSTVTAEFFNTNPHAFSSTYAAGILQISACEYWTMNRTAGTGTGRAILSWASNSSCNGGAYVGNMATLRVARLSAGTWLNDLNLSVTGSNSAGTITANATSTFSFTFALATSALDNALPVMFGEVKAYEKNSGVQIDWNNLTERDLVNYVVERSSNGQDFTAINQQSPKSNRNDAQSYSAFDASPVSGTNFYRIKVLEVSGKIIYSKILKVDIGGKQTGFTLYPNPVTGGQVSVSLNVKQGQYSVKVLNSTGQEVYSQKVNHQGGSMTQAIQLPASVKPGFYNMVVSGDNYRESKMFVVQ